jgi:hypothetical protein
MPEPPTGFAPAKFSDTLPIMQPTYAPSNIGSDPLRHLPPAAADRLRQLQQHVSDLRALCPSFEERNSGTNARIDAENRLKRLIARAAEGGFSLRDDDPTVVTERQRVDTLTAEAARVNELYATRAAAWQAASGVLGNVMAWLRDGGMPAGTMLESLEIEAPKLLKGEGALDGIERLRRRVRELRADLRRIQSAPFPSAHARARMHEQVEALAQRGAPDISSLIEHDGAIAWPTLRLRSMVIGGPEALAFGEVIDTVGLFAWMHRDALIARLDAEVASSADDGAALSPEARETAAAEVQADLLAVERDESALVWQALAQGLPVEHRADVSPLALLGLQLVSRPAGNGGLVKSSVEMVRRMIGPS